MEGADQDQAGESLVVVPALDCCDTEDVSSPDDQAEDMTELAEDAADSEDDAGADDTVETVDACEELPDETSCDVALGVLAVELVLNANDSTAEVVKDAEPDAADIDCEDCVGASEDIAGTEGAGVEEAAEPEEVAGADDGEPEDSIGAGGFADALGVVEDAAGVEDSAGADDIVGEAEDATGSEDIAGVEDEGTAELCCGPPGPKGPPPVQEA